MMKFASLLIGSENPKELLAFYEKVFQSKPEWSDGDWGAFRVGEGYVTFGPHDKVHGKSKEPERILINFETDDVEGEFSRIKELGATVIAAPYNPDDDKKMWIATLADPDGNFFQLMSPWEEKTN
jgi:predicted enzyme related to lactoylglutathione lyase